MLHLRRSVIPQHGVHFDLLNQREAVTAFRAGNSCLFARAQMTKTSQVAHSVTLQCELERRPCMNGGSIEDRNFEVILTQQQAYFGAPENDAVET